MRQIWRTADGGVVFAKGWQNSEPPRVPPAFCQNITIFGRNGAGGSFRRPPLWVSSCGVGRCWDSSPLAQDFLLSESHVSGFRRQSGEVSHPDAHLPQPGDTGHHARIAVSTESPRRILDDRHMAGAGFGVDHCLAACVA